MHQEIYTRVTTFTSNFLTTEWISFFLHCFAGEPMSLAAHGLMTAKKNAQEQHADVWPILKKAFNEIGKLAQFNKGNLVQLTTAASILFKVFVR